MHTSLRVDRFNLQVTDIGIQCKAVHHSVRHFSSASSPGRNDGKHLIANKLLPQSVFRLVISIENTYSCCHTNSHLVTYVWPYREVANNVRLYSHI